MIKSTGRFVEWEHEGEPRYGIIFTTTGYLSGGKVMIHRYKEDFETKELCPTTGKQLISCKKLKGLITRGYIN